MIVLSSENFETEQFLIYRLSMTNESDIFQFGVYKI